MGEFSHLNATGSVSNTLTILCGELKLVVVADKQKAESQMHTKT